jgi:arylsulfatase A-like enzyme
MDSGSAECTSTTGGSLAHAALGDDSPPPGQGLSTAQSRPEGIPIYAAVLPENVKAVPEYLRKAGYYAINNQETDYNFAAPVTAWTRLTLLLPYHSRPREKPFFAFYTLFMTHELLLRLNTSPLTVEPAQVTVPPIYPDTPAVRKGIARMYTNLAIMDQHLEESIKDLKDDGVYDNSIIFSYGNNGGNNPWYKREILERGTKVPLIVRFPGGRQGGTTNNALVSGVDFAPTVLSLAGIPIPS